MSAAPVDPLVAVLLPAWARRTELVRAELTRIAARMAACREQHGDGGRALEQTDLATALERALDDSRRLGWALGVLASAAGNDLLQARRERRGLDVLVELVDDALAQHGGGLAPHAGPLPELVPGARGWELPWALATLLLEAGRGAASRLGWRLEPDALRLARARSPELGEASARVARTLPGLALTESPAECVVRIPAGLLRAPR